ncbi:MAG TPA: hypothetical protein VJL60_03175 [Gammaproteobacteria bacterium]|nr:hypothetical protein [Gammaproteobacteria bacterium]
MQTNKRKNAPLFLLALVFILPMILSWLLYHYHNQFQFKTTNYGVFIYPPITIQLEQNKKWKIIYVNKGACDSSCEKTEHQLLQLQKALGKDRERVAVVFMNERDALSKKLSPDTIYLVDPIGNGFMYYPASTDPMNILKDMKHVLEVSQIG